METKICEQEEVSQVILAVLRWLELLPSSFFAARERLKTFKFCIHIQFSARFARPHNWNIYPVELHMFGAKKRPVLAIFWKYGRLQIGRHRKGES
jgi:hypothetical protein